MSDRALIVAGLVAGVLILSRRNASAVARQGIPVVNQNKDLYLAQGAFKFLGQVLKQPAQEAIRRGIFAPSGGAASAPAGTSSSWNGWDGGGTAAAAWDGTTAANDFGFGMADSASELFMA